jgi:hypothetical protein
MAGLAAGSKLLVRDSDPDPEQLWHERVLLGYLHDGMYLVITPDRDVYEEDFDPDKRTSRQCAWWRM